MILTDQCIIELDVPNKNGRIYPTAVVAKAIKVQGGQPMLGTLGMPQSLTIDLDKVSHQATNMRIIEGKLLADIQILDTPSGKMLKELMQSSPIVFRSAGSAIIDDNKIVSNFSIVSVAAIEESEAA